MHQLQDAGATRTGTIGGGPIYITLNTAKGSLAPGAALPEGRRSSGGHWCQVRAAGPFNGETHL
eukprot:254131-Pyramimonas_sp.AAC.1